MEFFLLLLLLPLTIQAIQISTLTSDILFERLEDVYISNSTWNIKIKFDLSKLDYKLQEIEEDFKVIENSLQKSTKNMENAKNFKDSLLNLGQYYNTLKINFNNLKKITPRKLNRKTRAINSIGSALSWAFGVLSDEDRQNYDNQIHGLKYDYDQIKIQTHDETVVLNNMERYIMNNTKFIKLIGNELKIAENKIKDTVNANELKETQEILDIKRTAEIEFNLRHLEYYVMQFANNIKDLAEAIKMATNHKLDTYLLPFQTFIPILKNIQDNLPRELTLIDKVNENTIFKFYLDSVIIVELFQENLTITVQIPILNNQALFESYKIITYPVYKPEIKLYLQWTTKPILFISKNRNLHASLTHES